MNLLERLARATGVTEHNTKPCRFFVLWLTRPWVGRRTEGGGPASVSDSPGPNIEQGTVAGSKAFGELEIKTHRLLSPSLSSVTFVAERLLLFLY